MKQISI